MLKILAKRMTYANIALTLALVFAMTGGAYAAKKYLITSTKQISPSVLTSLKGKPGKNGVAGPQGATGSQGPAGAQGPAGPAGAKGETGPAGPKGDTGPQGEEGAQGENGKEGKEGSPWTAGGTLPSGKTETGAWAAGKSSANAIQYVPISFALPLEKSLDETHVHILDESGKEFFEGKEIDSKDCEGSSSAPTAKPGNLCIYTAEDELITYDDTFIRMLQSFPPIGASTAGASLTIIFTGANGYGFGSWAVTAP